MEANKKIVIIGAGGHGAVIIDLIETIYKGKQLPEIELLDDGVPSGTVLYGKNVVGKVADCTAYPEGTEFIIAIGNNRIRKRIAEQYPLNYVTFIHPSAVVGRNVSLGQGTVVMANAVINCESQIGDHCIINTAATVDHENVIEDYVHLSPGVHLGGCVKVGECSWVGIGSTVIQGISIGESATVGAGTVVIRNVSSGTTVVGNPARVLYDRK